MENKHDRAIPQETLAEAMQLINQAYERLKLYMLSLTAEGRVSLPKMGNKLFSFVEKAGKLAELNPEYRPSFFDPEEFHIDLADAVALQGVLSRVQQLDRAIEDTMMVAGSEAYIQALAAYGAVKLAARNNLPGAKVICDELAESYPGKHRRSKNSE
jgi:hypothetical protein